MRVFTLCLSKYLSNKGLQGMSDSKLFNIFFRLCIVLREGIESLRTIHNRNEVLNSFELLMPWRPLLDKYFDRDNVNTRMRLF